MERRKRTESAIRSLKANREIFRGVTLDCIVGVDIPVFNIVVYDVEKM